MHCSGLGHVLSRGLLDTNCKRKPCTALTWDHVLPAVLPAGFVVHVRETTAQRYSKLQIPHLQTPQQQQTPSCSVWDCSPMRPCSQPPSPTSGNVYSPAAKPSKSVFCSWNQDSMTSPHKSGWTLPQIT